jgi:hypothetical protein
MQPKKAVLVFVAMLFTFALPARRADAITLR